MAIVKRKRSSCGYCTSVMRERHAHCPGTMPYACAGKPWTCWCSENGHPDVIPTPPVQMVEEPEGNDGPTVAPGTPEPRPEGKNQGPPKKEHTDRCGHPTSRGPCNRRAGHTAGHDGR